MTIWSKLINKFGGSKSLDVFLSVPSSTPTMTSPFEAATAYITNPDVYACVREISTAVAGISLRVVGDNGEFVEEHPLQSLLDNPNPFSGGSRWRESLVANLLITWSAYALRLPPNPQRPPKELYILPSLNVTHETDSSGTVKVYHYKSGAVSVAYAPELILSLAYFNPTSPLKGLSPISAAAAGIKIGDMARSWNYNLLAQGARPSGAIKVKTPLSEQSRERLKQELEEKFQGYRNAGRPLVLEGEIDWVNTGYSPAEMEYQNNLRLSTLDICRVFNVPPEMIGDSQNKTYSNYQEPRKAFYHETVLPLLDWICDSMTHWLAGLYEGVSSISYDHNEIEALQEDRNSVYDRVLRAVAQGVLTINEARGELGLSPLPGGDVPLVPSNFIPLDLVSGVPSKSDGL